MGFTVTIPNGGSDSANFYNFSGANLGQIVGTDLGGGVGTLTFKTNSNANSMVFDQYGNLGLGVTPSSWNIFKVLQIGTTGNFYAVNAGSTSVAYNSYYNGSNYTYQVGDYAQRYSQSSSGHLWFSAPSGTANNSITFTQAMTLNNSGYLALNTGTFPSGSAATAVFKGIGSNEGGLQLASSGGSGGALLATSGAAVLRFFTYTGAVGSETYTENMRLNNGVLLLGDTSTRGSIPSGYTGGVQIGNGPVYFTQWVPGGSTRTVTFNGYLNYFIEITCNVWGQGGAGGIFQTKWIAGRRDYTGAAHVYNSAQVVGTGCSVSTSYTDNSPSSQYRSYTLTFSLPADGLNEHWVFEIKSYNVNSLTLA